MNSWFKKAILVSSIACMAAFSHQVFAQENHAPAIDKVEKVLGLEVSSVADAPVDGLLQVITNRGLFYISQDGKYFMQARIFNLDEDMRNETEEALGEIRNEGLKKFENDAIVFKAKDEKYVVNVFTDITCGYCRRLHSQIAEYNDLGITVRYLAFPRGGMQSQSFEDMVSVWCAKDPLEAMTTAKSGDAVKPAKCENPVAEQYEFGQLVGVTGTPNIILPDGSLIGGYQPAPMLLQSLKQI
ncbi:bifunctional protein-disulfide isomerase/oxidoreductase DsbC [Aestuariibacter sp. AA17]|uniref:Thiol:disulfide interchange protein n=1 Tax=Fluctibacter corallii TaxID=2984329 RepID=A0ABT3A4E6_9ALTE|nr:bifunctional protein-disulfide isomerase/oxidoreductase DsbC [Aestuariibacter sp. AA17]MCV2883560.1 bifunctional protein-disulfide isomerase/oxidoreductase DsbC [Aestuariibacter sp. AA17]